ncbi:hypothetical protein EMIHUDRAFT_216158 [Emiliania huxleyi CCMP1516]|uniref:DUF4326 domain-containing protein n=2 Tax=Emiliania huxleyi TaxID=2903 RepID=A0A0D3IFI4_EMIH1|nr:hypothetical protein EMIHUDRAFT_216158 [Emiliania huxleyi CCMP1516]EOD10019.1 hypothetical protein EMIHUDRAFT_216158 [Emiliania huxleyi CCMP1516]|eukprot:XP_005762448.1 hypothetical protein EMIHUDRAFT_216158 [Emiliania huxleyi CCMP1516]
MVAAALGSGRGEQLPGEQLPGEQLPGEQLPGEQLPGDLLRGDLLRGDVCRRAGHPLPRQPLLTLEEELCDVLGVSLDDADVVVLREALRRGCVHPRLRSGFDLGAQCASSPWGNPFPLRDPRDSFGRRECVREFAARLRASPAFVERVRRELAGFFLACCCSSCSDPSKRRLCHGHVLFYIANCSAYDLRAFLSPDASALDEVTWTTKNWHGLQMQRLSVVLHTAVAWQTVNELACGESGIVHGAECIAVLNGVA